MSPRLQDWLYIHHGIRLGLPGYLDILVLSIALGALLLLRHCRKQELNQGPAYLLAILSIPLLFLGGKIVYAAQFPQALERGWGFWRGPGSALYGGLLGLFVAAVIAFRVYRVSPWPYLDGLALSMALGLFLTRIGCFLAGCNWGAPTDLAWGVRFPPGSHAFKQHVRMGLIPEDAALSLPVHPTQLYESLAGLLLLLFGFWMIRRKAPAGRTFFVLTGLYAGFRFVEEFVRADYGASHGWLTFAQWVSLGMLALLAGACAAARRAGSDSDRSGNSHRLGAATRKA